MNSSLNPQIERINVLTAAIKRARNDSQRFAALLAVSKMLKADELTESQRKNIFLAIGFSFPIRLLTSSGDEESPKAAFNDLGMSVLTSFVSDQELAQAPEHKKIVPVVLELVEERSQDSAQNKAALYDCFCYLAAVAAADHNCSIIAKQNGVQRLVDVFCAESGDDISPMFWSILLNLIAFDGETVWRRNKESILLLLEHVAEQASRDFSEKKFELFERLSRLLLTLSSEYSLFYSDKKWMRTLKKSLLEVLCSRVSSKERNPTLRLCHHLTESFGLSWTVSEKTGENAKRLSVLLLKLSCVEIHLIIHCWLNEKDITKIIDSENMTTFVVCSALVEAGCTAIADYDSEQCHTEVFSYENVEELQGSLIETIEGIGLSLLPKILKISELKDLVLCCLRTIGSWLNIHVFATSTAGLGILKIIYAAFEFCLRFEPSIAIKSLTPAFLHYAENENAKKQLIDLDIISCLNTTLIKSDVSEEIKCLCSQCLMTFCVESQNLEEFDIVLPALMDYSLTLNNNDALCFYVSVLGLMFWNKRCDLSLQHPQSKRFFQNIVRLLHNIHAINGDAVKVSTR